MLSEKKIRMMIRLADYEQGNGKTDLRRTSYYKTDYIKVKVLQTILSVTLAFFLLMALFCTYRMEFIVSNALLLDYSLIGVQFLVIYVLTIILFTVITIGLESIHYDLSKKRVRKYYQILNVLLEHYGEEETP